MLRTTSVQQYIPWRCTLRVRFDMLCTAAAALTKALPGPAPPDAAVSNDSDDGGVSPPRTPPSANGMHGERGASAQAQPAAALSTTADPPLDTFQVVPRGASDSESDTDAEPRGHEEAEVGTCSSSLLTLGVDKPF